MHSAITAIGFTSAITMYPRDFTLPGQQEGPIGFLMYPYAETTHGPKDSLDPEAFSYTITSKEIA